MSDAIVNKVAQSGLITLNLEDYLPQGEVVPFDLKDFLFMGLILKEKDFREALKTLDLNVYSDKIVAITCSADAVIPMWAYMLVASLLQPVAKEIIFANEEAAKKQLLLKNISLLNAEDFAGERVVIKGCGDVAIPEEAYIAITAKLRPQVRSIMYGEPCSTVPVFKKEKLQVS